ncbi:MAG: nicotinate (nicotinamide) nucleotide adenylyltransferase [Proteobacteria bacterium]|nr:nicotinate (nicotinamide) nucleotide adenylyltransferase [Pseudomonadota bacterium]
MKIALFGGTFDPVHYGHLRLAEEVREALGFSTVLFMPSATPPHKAREEVTPVGVRLEMLSAAVESNPHFEVSDIEVVRQGKEGAYSYTVDTVKELMGAHSKRDGAQGLEISLIVGADSFNEITTWCDYDTLLELVSFVVVARPGYAVKKIAEVLPVELARKFWYDSSIEGYRNEAGRTVTYLGNTLLDISSTRIRELISVGASVEYLLQPEVLKFIEAEGLYIPVADAPAQ